MSLLFEERSVAIRPTGLRFYQDSSEQARKNFEAAVKDVTEKYGMTSADFWSSYRILRLKELKQENQAVSVTDETNAKKITMDVRDFKTSDLSVTTEGLAVEVEGRVERHEGGSLSTHCFRRRFTMPETADLAAASAVVSTDGVLTVTVPKTKSPEPPSEERTLFRNLSPSFFHPTVTPKKSSVVSDSLLEEDRDPEIVTRSIDYQSSNTHSADMTSPDGKIGDLLDRSTESAGETTLPVMLRGSFFDDEFFRHAHNDFQEAVEKILKKHDIGTSTPERMKKYRYLREDNLSDDTQAVTISEDDSCHKIVLDAHDFKDGDLKVKRVGRCLVVEGRVQKAVGGSTSTHSFLRRFALPSQANLSDVTAALSLDGVLTIVVKKYRATPMPASKTPSSLVMEEELRRPAGVKTSSEIRTGEQIRSSSPRTWDMGQRTPVSAMRSERKVSFNAEVHESEIPSKRRKIDEEEEDVEPEIIEEDSDDDIQEIKETTTTASMTQNRPKPEEGTPTTTRTKESSHHFQRRGNLFQTSLLPEDQNRFQSAATKVLEKYGMRSPAGDDRKSFGVADRSSAMEQIQATEITDDGKTYKVTLDVSDFVIGEVEVKAEGQTLVIEGLCKKKEENSTCSQGFRRCFTVPSSVELESVSSDLSPEGILTISAPKRAHVSFCEEDASSDDIEMTDFSRETEARESSSRKFEAKVSSPFIAETRFSSPIISEKKFSSPLTSLKTSSPIVTERKITSIQKEEVRVTSPCSEVIRLPSPPKEVTTVSSSHEEETRVSSPVEVTEVSSGQSEETKASSPHKVETKVSSHMEKTEVSTPCAEETRVSSHTKTTVSSIHKENAEAPPPVKKKTKVGSSQKKVVKKSALQKEKIKASPSKKPKAKVSPPKKVKTAKVSTPKKEKTAKVSTPKKTHPSPPAHHTPHHFSDGILTRSTCKASPGGRCCCKELTFDGES